MNKKKLFLAVVLSIVLTVLLSFAVSAESYQPHWILNADGTYSYMDSDGELVKDEVSKWIDGDYYGFDAKGIMYTGWVQPYKNKFFIDEEYRNQWYLFGSDGRAVSGYKAGYYFWHDGSMATDTWFDVYNENIDDFDYYICGNNGKVTQLEPIGWNNIDGEWYYLSTDRVFYHQGVYTLNDINYYFDHMGRQKYNTFGEYYDVDKEDWYKCYVDNKGNIQYDGWVSHEGEWYFLDNGYLATGEYEIGQTWYIFDYEGRLMKDTFDDYYNEDAGEWYKYYINSNGVAQYDGWVSHEGDWYYLANGRLVEGKYMIGSTYYYFDIEGILYTNRGFYEDGYYYATESGALLCDQWRPVGSTWEYYDSACERLEYVSATINGKRYAFDDEGKMIVNEIRRVDYTWYLFGADGVAKEVSDGWNYEASSGKYMYFEDGYPVSDEIISVGGKEYAIDGYYLVDTDTYGYYYYQGDNDKAYSGYAYYSINANGTVNRTPGWDTVDGTSWVFIQSDGRLKTGWLYDNSSWYYLSPTMYKNVNGNIGGRTYYFDSKGRSSDVYSSGYFKYSGETTYYYEYGTVASGWRLISGNWYYFNNSMYTDGVYRIGSEYYYFNQEGIMQTGWFRGIYDSWYYADSSGHLYTGLKTINGIQYLFGSNGELLTDGRHNYDGTIYITSGSGVVIADSNDPTGWYQNEANGNWYYLDDGYFCYWDYDYYINGKYYTFDGQGAMISDEILEGSYYQADGSKFNNGWFELDGEWYYADEDGDLAWGRKYINGKYYYFVDYKMAIGTFVYDGYIASTDNSGAVVSTQRLQEGWNLVSELGQGHYYYVKDGNLYYGWLGSYYLDPVMICDSYYWIDGNYYYFNEKGVYAANTWILDDDGDWAYAQANGKLYEDEWALINGKWYYFDSLNILSNGTYYVDDEQHNFDKSGVWLGKATTSTRADGWYNVNGKWQYSVDGEFIYSGIYKIDGTWYGFEDEVMVTNDFNSDGYYMNGSGVVMQYTGWKTINGKWYYFTKENKIAIGWFKVGNDEYYGTYNGIATGYKVIGNNLYNFASGGALVRQESADGWYGSGSTWYYIRDNKVVRNEVIIIGNTRYAFDYDGKMIVNGYCNDGAILYLFGSNGAQITTQGWYKIDGEWLYVDANGYLLSGTHIMGGTSYYFDLDYYYYYY